MRDDLLKIQVGDVYIQIPVDDKFYSSMQLAIDSLEFMLKQLRKKKQDAPKPQKESI